MASAQPLTDHDEIRSWAEARRARPACVKGTGAKNDAGMIRLDFPGFSGGDSLQEISWDEWFRRFDESNLALLVQEKTSRGQRSNFNKLVSRGTAGARASARKRAGAEGERRGTRDRAAASSRGGARAGGARKSKSAGRETATGGRRASPAPSGAGGTGTRRLVRARKSPSGRS